MGILTGPRFSGITLAALLALPALSGAAAHDLWLERESGGLCLRHGHLPSGHGGPRVLDYDPAVVLRTDCFGPDARPVECAPEPACPLRIGCDCAVTCVLTSTGYWTKTPYGTRNVTRTEAETPIRSWQSFESVKRVDRWTEALARPLTRDLELVALDDPLALSPGNKLHLRVTYLGEPVEGAVVTYGDDPRGATDQQGRVNIRLRHDGFQVVKASLTLPHEGPEADEVIHIAALNFELEASR